MHDELLRPLLAEPEKTYSLLSFLIFYLLAFFIPSWRRLVGWPLFVLSCLLLLFCQVEKKTDAFLSVWIVLFTLSAIKFKRSDEGSIRNLVWGGTCFFLCWLGLLHLIPFFENWRIVSGVMVSKGAPTYSVYFNADKAIVGAVILLTLSPVLSWKEKKGDWCVAVALGILACCILYFLGWASNLIDFHPKWPYFSLLWIPLNLFFVCYAEELFFREFLMGQILPKAFFFCEEREKRIFSLLISSCLFALFHYRLGFVFMILAFLAGGFYGLCYLFTRRVEASTVTHFMVNGLHFFFFTYPVLKSG